MSSNAHSGLDNISTDLLTGLNSPFHDFTNPEDWLSADLFGPCVSSPITRDGFTSDSDLEFQLRPLEDYHLPDEVWGSFAPKHDISQPTIPDYHPTIPDYHDMGPARVMLPIIDISSEFFSTNFSSAVSTSTAIATSSIIPSLPTTVALPTISPSNAPSSTLEDSDGAGPSRPQSPSKTDPPSDSEDDTSVYGESDDDDSDDEYVPAGGASPKRKRSPRSDKLLLRNSSASSPPALGETEDDLPSPTKFPRAAPPRSKQVLTTLGQTDVSSPSTLKGANRWACPHCDFVQKNHRMPDLKRHIRKHYPTNKYVCCGVPVEEKEKYGAKETAAPMEYNGRMMVGGCMQSMSRRDALKRHIDNKNVTCVGDLEGDWHQFQG